MNELIKLNEQTINHEMVQTVNARELHAFLGNGDMFANWIKNRIEKYGFVENQDYTLLHKKMEQYDFIENEDFLIISQNRETTDKDGKLKVSVAKEYHITLDMAKELAMGR